MRSTLSVFDAVTIMVGLVVGIGIFRTPSLVAANVESEIAFIAVWVAGGLVTLIGALCYAELAAAHPHAGGEYHFLSRAYGKPLATLFGWARGSVIQTGAIAGVAFVLGDYAAQIVPLGPFGPAIYAAGAIVLFTAVNVAGTLQGKALQIAMTYTEIAAIGAIIAFGFFGTAAPAPAAPVVDPEGAALGMAMIFVLLTYGGWNEAAYLTGELKDPDRNVARVLVLGTLILVGLYVLANLALLSILGLDGLRGSEAVAADMMRRVVGEDGALIVSLAIVVAAISTLNATIFTGARVYYAMARDLTLLPRVGEWNDRGKTPANGLILQAIVALLLVAIGAATRDGFKAMVDYTAPVFWGFLLLVGIALIVLRIREPGRTLPYKVPLYPLTPILFCLSCAYMLHASIAYTGFAALIGLGVLAAGTPLLLFSRKAGPALPHPKRTSAVKTLSAFFLAGALASLMVADAVAQTAPAPAAAPSAASPTPYQPHSGQPGKDVVWVPTPDALVAGMLDMAQVTGSDYLVDLGSGDGRTVIAAAKRGVRAHGLEFNPDLVALSRRNAEAAGVADRATFAQADIFETDFSDATVVTLFLLPALNARLRPILLDMKPGTRIVSNSFDMGDWPADQKIKTGGSCTAWCRAYKWVVPAKVGGTWALGDGTLALQQTYQILEGTLTEKGRAVPISDAKMSGTHIAFTAGGRRYHGDVTGDKMSGTIEGQTAASWSATRTAGK